MKKFLFRLETLLKIRRAHVGQLKRELGLSEVKFNEWEEKKITLQKQIDALVEEMRGERRAKTFAIHDTYAQILDHLNISLKNVEATLATLKKQIEMKQERLKHVIQERKIIEKIQEKQYAAWRVREEQADGALIDEIAVKRPNS